MGRDSFCRITIRITVSSRRRGSALLLALFVMVLLLVVGAFAVDWGRSRMAQAQLQSAVDAATRYGATKLGVSAGAVEARVYQSLSENPVDGLSIPDSAVTVSYYDYDAAAETLSETTAKLANSVGVRVELTGDDGVAVMFGEIVGLGRVGIAAESVATLHTEMERIGVGACYNPWLAGAAPGTVANQYNMKGNPDYAGPLGASGSPVGLTLDLSGGDSLAFDSINGGAAFDPSLTLADADGYTSKVFTNRFATGRVREMDEPYLDLNGDGQPDAGWPGQEWKDAYPTNNNGVENGIADIAAPACSVIAVFLGPGVPVDGDEASTQLLFDTTERRDFTVLKPELNQPFFIGDGRTSDGKQQRFEIPAGATRIFLGVMDLYEWNNNVGGFTTAVKEYGKITTIR